MTCETCGKPLVVNTAYNGNSRVPAKFCSAACRNKPRKERSAKERRERYRKLKLGGANALQAAYGSGSRWRSIKVWRVLNESQANRRQP